MTMEIILVAALSTVLGELEEIKPETPDFIPSFLISEHIQWTDLFLY